MTVTADRVLRTMRYWKIQDDDGGGDGALSVQAESPERQESAAKHIDRAEFRSHLIGKRSRALSVQADEPERQESAAKHIDRAEFRSHLIGKRSSRNAEVRGEVLRSKPVETKGRGCRRWRPALLVSLLALALSFGGAPTASADEELVIVQGSGNPQLEFCRQLLGVVFQRVGKKVKVVSVPAERAIRLTSEGVVDGDCLRVSKIVDQYSNLVQVPEYLHTVSFTAFSTKIKHLPDGWESLKPYRVATPSGWKLIEERISTVSPRQVLEVIDTEALFSVLALGRVDIGISNLVSGWQYFGEYGNEGGIFPILPPLEQVPLFLTLNEKNRSLIDPLTQAIIELKEQGIWKAIFADTFDQDHVE